MIVTNNLMYFPKMFTADWCILDNNLVKKNNYVYSTVYSIWPKTTILVSGSHSFVH